MYIWVSWQDRNLQLGHSFEFSRNVFPEFTEFSDKNICNYSNRTRTCHPATSWVRDQDATTAPTQHMRDRIFELSPSAIYQIPWIRWIQWIPVSFNENSFQRFRCKIKTTVMMMVLESSSLSNLISAEAVLILPYLALSGSSFPNN